MFTGFGCRGLGCMGFGFCCLGVCRGKADKVLWMYRAHIGLKI